MAQLMPLPSVARTFHLTATPGASPLLYSIASVSLHALACRGRFLAKHRPVLWKLE
jgi:hypothetical protein